MRIICSVPYRAHTANLFVSLGILPFGNINTLQVDIFMYRFHVRLLPSDFNHWFIKNLDIHSHQSRSSNKYHQIRTHTTVRQHSIRMHGPIFLNMLPLNLTNLPRLYQLKRKLKTYCIVLYSSIYIAPLNSHRQTEALVYTINRTYLLCASE